jgi:hypothetical protein
MCNCSKGNLMDSNQLTKLAIAGGILFAAYKFGGKYGAAGAIAVGAVIVAKRVPYVNDVI